MTMTRLIAIAAGLTLFLGSPAAQTLKDEEGSETYRQLELFADVMGEILTKHVNEASEADLIEAAITGMLTSLDPHSGYLSPKRFRDMQRQTRGEFGGLGIEVTKVPEGIKVIAPIHDTPAFRAGIKAGDLITRLDGQSVQGLSLAEAVEKMRGKVDTDLILTIRREGREPFDVTITRAIIKTRSVAFSLKGKDFGYIQIRVFNENTNEQVISAVENLNKESDNKLKGLILDLRNNPGGLLSASVQVADAFLSQGEIVSTRSRQPDDSQRFNAKDGDISDGLPIVVLVNSGSASASEIVAGALQDHRRGLIMGTRTFGKGSVQTVIPLGPRGAIRLTTAHYYTPSGRTIQAKGINPDIVVEEGTPERASTPERRREEDLRGRLDNPDDSSSDEITSQEQESDYQVSRAIDFLRGISLYNQAN